MADEPDAVLLSELRQGNTAALRALYRRCQPRLFSYLQRLSGRPEVAQDLSSEVWCRAAAKLHTLRPDSQLLPWLFTIARNLFFSYCRWRNRDEHYLNELGRLQFSAAPPPTPLETTMRSEREAQLKEALAGLPAIYREAVILVAIEGFTHEQAAQVAGVRADAVRKRFSRGIQLIKSMVAWAGEPPEGEQHE
jgi:RNA polymerase sigma-70 factor (ECF subfamily)